eukprot:TRINITY_DN1546_c0_g1_i2.p2 TRINITY_DN1546_c0_g1~~TRINITY_DN1546_c0_g1_i2.p2  ORF type:complete len:234 (-),score=37.25 TRINITY_DN1546_c0_g1_i2:276-977(-)
MMEPGVAPEHWEIKPLEVRVASKLRRLGAVQDAVQLIWECGTGQKSVQTWLWERKLASLFQEFNRTVYREGRLVVPREYRNDGQACGLLHWVKERGLSFSSDVVNVLAAVGCESIPAEHKSQLKEWAVEVCAALLADLTSGGGFERSASLVSEDGRPWVHVFLRSLDLMLDLIEPGSGSLGEGLVAHDEAMFAPGQERKVLECRERAIQDVDRWKHLLTKQQVCGSRPWRPAQ